MRRSLYTLAALGLILLLCAGPALALSAEAQVEFDRIMAMSLVELTEASATLLDQKYPDEDWDKWHFPDYVFGDQTIETSYKVAVKEPELLGMANVSDQSQVIPCYCTCESFGHENLLYCFWKDGVVGGEFDEHGSQCGVCMRQAFLAFLWADLGATHAEIMQGMRTKFAPLLKMQEEGKI